MLNVKDAYRLQRSKYSLNKAFVLHSHPLFFRKVDERTGFFTRNILCLPIKDATGELIGVAELCNKLGRSTFTDHDEQIAAAFSVYCAISISHVRFLRPLIRIVNGCAPLSSAYCIANYARHSNDNDSPQR